MKKIYLSLLLMMLIVGCSSNYKHYDNNVSAVLDPNQSVYVVTPQKATFENTVYEQSGIQTAAELEKAFSRHAFNTSILSFCNRAEECIAQHSLQSGYLVIPNIIHWEDRATEWSGKKDKIEIQVVVYDAATQSVLANNRFSGTSKWATFGGDHPQDLLAEPFNDLVSKLYR